MPPGDFASVAALPAGRWWDGFFAASEDAHVVCRTDGLIERINPRAARILKLAPAVADGKLSVFDSLAAPADQKLADVLSRGLIHPETLHTVTTVVAGRTNGLVDLEITPLDAEHTLVTFKDAARRTRLESHVNRLVTAIDATPVVFFLTDTEFRIT